MNNDRHCPGTAAASDDGDIDITDWEWALDFREIKSKEPYSQGDRSSWDIVWQSREHSW